jgi:hypothetical protein
MPPVDAQICRAVAKPVSAAVERENLFCLSISETGRFTGKVDVMFYFSSTFIAPIDILASHA